VTVREVPHPGPLPGGEGEEPYLVSALSRGEREKSRPSPRPSPEGRGGRAQGAPVRTWARALRVAFLPASLLPYTYGALLAQGPLRAGRFALGLAAVAATALSANAMNDYADARAGADSQDPEYYAFFGGSKLIQQGRLCPGAYLCAALGLAVVAALAAAALAWTLGRPGALVLFAGALGLGWAYTAPPLRLGYRRLGEATVFLVFGLMAVGAGAFAQTGAVPTLRVLALSAPFACLIAAVLVANEVPDAAEDAAAGKHTLVTTLGARRGYLLFSGLAAGAFAAILGSVAAGWLRPVALVAFAGAPLGWRAARILRWDWAEKRALVRSSRLALGLHAIVSLALIGEALCSAWW